MTDDEFDKILLTIKGLRYKFPKEEIVKVLIKEHDLTAVQAEIMILTYDIEYHHNKRKTN